MISDADLDEAMSVALRAENYDEFERLAVESDRRTAERETRLSAPDALARAAEWYTSRGVAVFPILPRDKRPFPGSRGFKDATADIGQVRAWWRRYPDANIGAPTGITFDVIDVDGPPGYQSLADLKETGSVPPLIGRAITPRGGRHLFITPTGDGNAAGFRRGLDYRGAGGYVVLAPSVGPNGNRYDWIEPLHLGATA